MTIRLDLRGGDEFYLPGLSKHKVVELAWLSKSTNSHPIIAKTSPALRVKVYLSWAEIPDSIQTALMLATQPGDIPDVEDWARHQRGNRD